jgi:hypothetical protein
MYKKEKGLTITRLAKIVVPLVFITFFITTCNLSQSHNSPVGQKKWSFLFYDDADFNRAYDPFRDFKNYMCSSENLNVLILRDQEYGPAKIWYVDKDHNPICLKELGEINMGDYQSLYDFVDYSKENYPAERYIISFYNHGAAWQGACIDKASDNDILTMDEMQRALTNTGGVDIVCFSAPCLMGALESVYELRNCTDIYMGSEEGSGYIIWLRAMEQICETLNQNPDITSIKLGEEIIGIINQNTMPLQSNDLNILTMSAIRTDRINEVIQAVEELSLYYLSHFDASCSFIQSVYNSVLVFGNGFSMDLYDFAERCHDVETDPAVISKLEHVMESLSDAVIAKCNGSRTSNAHGLSIYFPNSPSYSYDPRYGDSNYGLDFSTDTHWDEFLDAYFSAFSVEKNQEVVDHLIHASDGLFPPK